MINVNISETCARSICTSLFQQDPDFILSYLDDNWDLYQDVIKNYLIGADISELKELIINAETEIEEKQTVL